VRKKVKKSKFVATLLAVDKCLLQQIDHLANQEALQAQDSLKHVELNSKIEQFTFTNAQYSISNGKRLVPYLLGYGVSFL
jgi:hypothetical protein